MNNPFTDGKKIKLGYDYFAKGFTGVQINEAYYRLIANPEQERLLLETATIDEINEIYNPGDDYYEENDRLTTDVIMEAIRVQKFARTDKKMAAFIRVLNTQMKDKGIEAQAPIIGTPKKSGLFATVTVQIPFSDGQILSIIFHSPDNNKMKIMADDEIIAFRWLLNKRDITQVVSIESEEVSLQEIGKRMSQLIEKNSVRFQSTQKHLVEQKKQLEDSKVQAEELSKKHDELMAQLKTSGDDAELLDAKIAKLKEQIGKQKNFNDDLQAKIDALKAKQAGNDGKPVGGTTPKNEAEMKEEQEAAAFAEKRAAFEQELKGRGFEGNVYDDRISATLTKDNIGQFSVFVIDSAVSEKKIFSSKTLTGTDTQIKKALAWIDKKLAETKKKKDEASKPTEIEEDVLAALGVATITDVGNENIYFEKDGKNYFSKVGNTDNYKVGSFDFAAKAKQDEEAAKFLKDREERERQVDETRRLTEVGQAAVPGIRLQDAETAGKLAEMKERGELSQEDWDKYVADLKASNKIESNEPKAEIEPAAVAILNDIIIGKYGKDTKAIDKALDEAAAELEEKGLMEEYDALLNQAADALTVILKEKAKGVAA